MCVHELDERLPVASPAVIYRAVGDGAVLLCATDEVYYGLNRVGARIWELLQQGTKSITELCAALQCEYPHVDPSTLRSDAVELLRDLIANGLAVKAEAEQAA
jgi:hypothetical protein